MKEKIKKILKNKIFLCVLTAFISTTIGVSAVTYFPSNDVTYDNTESGLQSTNVQGALDELYNVCINPQITGIASTILKKENLEKDKYECRYFFVGTNPKNYILFSGELWRIISAECDGTIKIMRNKSGGKAIWNNGPCNGYNNWANPYTGYSLMASLNDDYLNTLSDKDKIAKHEWSIGPIKTHDNLSTQINNENTTKWIGNIGLITSSEYIRANSNQNSCGSYKLNNNNYANCNKTNWITSLFGNNIIATINSIQGDTNGIVTVGGQMTYGVLEGFIDENGAANTLNYFPVLYLSSEVKITGGDGSQNNPYTIE